MVAKTAKTAMNVVSNARHSDAGLWTKDWLDIFLIDGWAVTTLAMTFSPFSRNRARHQRNRCERNHLTASAESCSAKRLSSASFSFASISFSAQSFAASLRQPSRLLLESVAVLLDLSERHFEARQLGFSRRQLGP
jgi:hypothetical protein